MEETAWPTMLGLGPLARLARAHVLGYVAVLPYPEGETADQRPRLSPPEVPPKRPVMARV